MELTAPGYVLDTLADRGWALVDGPAPALGLGIRMKEEQPIRPVPPGRSFASTRGYTPLHTDSQDFLGAPPGLQVMECVVPARSGGESLLLDAWALARSIERHDAALFAALLTEPRRSPFYFGAVLGPTLARKGGATVFTHSPMPPCDRVGKALQVHLDRARPVEIAVAAGQSLLVDNHRMLHGRRAFTDIGRSFVRTLAWLDAPLSEPGFESCQRLERPSYPRPTPAQLALVNELLAGVPPAKVASRAGVSEAELYLYRSAAFAHDFKDTAPLHQSRPA